MTVYTPNSNTAQILERGYDLVKSVPYRVTARWVFYRLLQDGFYSKKNDYKNKWVKAVSKARHTFYKGWRPDTLVDDTRDSFVRGRGSASVDQWLYNVSENAEVKLDKWITQDVYVELWYEARAMTEQFAYYTEHVTLRPMGGQPSIPYKWAIAKDLEDAKNLYDKPIVILYFGDLDDHGSIISEVVERDVRGWCEAGFEFIRCGLTYEQVEKYRIPENFEKPNEYQWEALPDEGAREIITSNVSGLLRQDAFTRITEAELQATGWFRDQVRELCNN